MGAAFLQSPSKRIGYTGDSMFQVAMTTCFRKPCPIIALLVGSYFGKGGAKFDKYRANLAAAAALPGQEHLTVSDFICCPTLGLAPISIFLMKFPLIHIDQNLSTKFQGL